MGRRTTSAPLPSISSSVQSVANPDTIALPYPNPDANSNANANTDGQPDAHTQPDDDTDGQPGAHPHTQPDADTNANTNGQPDANRQPNAYANTDSDRQSDAGRPYPDANRSAARARRRGLQRWRQRGQRH